ncbi:hypothetical protein [Streptomyces rishiriensis]|uniref:hypothetical protein n=1 Tax=Streptomyces rishiriensis TaxID=68264 RepID=UPI0033DE46B2
MKMLVTALLKNWAMYPRGSLAKSMAWFVFSTTLQTLSANGMFLQDQSEKSFAWAWPGASMMVSVAVRPVIQTRRVRTRY